MGQPRDVYLGNNQQTRYRYWALDFTFAPRNNTNYAYGRLRQICVTGIGAAACAETMGTTQPLNVSYDYDVAGNLTALADWPRNEVPSFSYDHLNRLTGVSGAYTENYGYDVIGNITSKTGVGNYVYSAQPSWGCAGGPHAVRNVPNVVGYCYDSMAPKHPRSGEAPVRRGCSGPLTATCSGGLRVAICICRAGMPTTG